MGVWSVVFLVAVAGFSVNADSSAVFPEIARGGSRIVSGWEAEEGQIPFQFSLRMVNGVGTVTSCGGSIIHPEWGLTAAHCTAGRITFVVRAGTVNLTRPDNIFETTEFYNHPNYNNNLPTLVQPDDISLLKFNRVLIFGDKIQPIRLQTSVDMNKNYDGKRLMASGWGRTWTDGSAPENLNWVYLMGESNENCRVAYGFSTIIQDSTICANGYNVSSQSTCQGDSGGPLYITDDDGGITQVGVSSFVSAQGCHVPLPAGFIRPGHYHDWYLDVTGIDFDGELKPTTPTPEHVITVTQPETTTPEEVITVGPLETTPTPEEVGTVEPESSESSESSETSESLESSESSETSESLESSESSEESRSEEDSNEEEKSEETTEATEEQTEGNTIGY